MEVSGGSGTATPVSGPLGVTLSVNGLSALYAGIPVQTLRLSGLMSGDDRYDQALEAAFAAKPYMLDSF
ncbi:hypothetical protein ACFQYP_09895 [Nonomuraea antimicrobica]